MQYKWEIPRQKAYKDMLGTFVGVENFFLNYILVFSLLHQQVNGKLKAFYYIFLATLNSVRSIIHIHYISSSKSFVSDLIFNT